MWSNTPSLTDLSLKGCALREAHGTKKGSRIQSAAETALNRLLQKGVCGFGLVLSIYLYLITEVTLTSDLLKFACW